MRHLHFQIILCFLILFILGCNQKTEIDSWSFREAGTTDWLPATVPGAVHLDLLDNGLIPNPFEGTNEPQLKYLETKDWEYRTTFQLSSELMQKEHVDLTFEGLDTYADVFLNDSLIIQANNMHLPWTAEVRSLLKQQDNELLVRFYSPVRKGQERLEELSYLIPNGNESVPLGHQNSVFSRKAQYHFGWDWGPRLVSSGIWRKLKFKGWNIAKIDQVKVDIQMLNEKVAIGNVQIDYSISENNMLDAEIEFEGAEDSITLTTQGLGILGYRFIIKNPKRWWPNGMGEQHLYPLKIKLKEDGKTIDEYEQKIGLRKVEFVQESDSVGQSFYFKINDQPVFMKGANYIPADFFNTRASRQYERVIQNAVDANMNMLRVWGGAIYENDAFYELCDEKGILIWQDFMSACAMIPTQQDYLDNFAAEAKNAVQRLHNHPSVILWCGNNENLTGWLAWGWQDTYDLHGADSVAVWQAYDTFFNQTLKKIVSEYGNGNYWPTSPSSGVNQRENKLSGDQHEWGIWFGQKDFEHFDENAGRFISEYGLQSFPSMSTIRRFDPSIKDWKLETPALNFRQRSKMNWIEQGFDGFDMMRFYLETYYTKATDLEDFVYKSQLTQALGLQSAIEAHRRHKPYTMGSLYWQIDDVWPTISWSTVDYYGQWKGAHYRVRDANKPTIVCAHANDDVLKVHAITDLVAGFKGQLKMELLNFDGTLINDWNMPVQLAASQNKIILKLPLSTTITEAQKKTHFLKMTLMKADEVVDRGLYYFLYPKELTLPRPNIDLQFNGNKITLKSDVLAKGVALSLKPMEGVSEMDLHFTDNYFDLLPGEEKEVELEGWSALVDFSEDLVVRFLKD